ncbi:MAG: phosphoglycerate kinase [Candidatus Magasanikbacteria bacterium]|nr:phosphoglycerate kinase [Candidatus Magasanikbacteria bacterium]
MAVKSLSLRTIGQLKNLAGRRVLLRVDFNAPIKARRVVDDFKIRASLPTIRHLLKEKAKLIIVSHLGRPHGVEPSLSLAPVARQLGKLLAKNIPLCPLPAAFFTRGTLPPAISRLPAGAACLLENIRFYPGEEKNDPALARGLARLADIFVLDGFAVAHRDAASVSGVAGVLPSYAGSLVAQEVKMLSGVLARPRQPFVVVLGGAKVETKIPVLRQLLPKADHILVGGEIANTYWWAKGLKVGSSLVGKKFKQEVLKYCASPKVIMPVDVVVGTPDGQSATLLPLDSQFSIPRAKFGVFDIGPATVQLFAEYLKSASTIVWNGAMGKFEVAPYHFGTYALAELIAARSRGAALGIAGGGETVEVLRERGIIEAVDFVSTGGGAMLEFLGGKKLPGLQALLR